MLNFRLLCPGCRILSFLAPFSPWMFTSTAVLTRVAGTGTYGWQDVSCCIPLRRNVLLGVGELLGKHSQHSIRMHLVSRVDLSQAGTILLALGRKQPVWCRCSYSLMN
jgi:hypothetical protein